MNIEELLIGLLIDNFELALQCNGVSKEEIDNLALDSDGNYLSDKDFFMKYSEQLNDDLLYDGVYTYLCEEKELDVPLDAFISILSSKCFVKNYGKDHVLTKYFKENANNLENIIILFKTVPEFGIELVKSYFWSIAKEKDYLIQRKKIYENKENDILVKYEQKSFILGITTISQILRDQICHLYNYYLSQGCNEEIALNNVWEYFINDFDPLNELEKLNVSTFDRHRLKYYALSLMYADLYEDSCNESIIKSETYEERMAEVLPIIISSLGFVSIPDDKALRNHILYRFIILQDNKEKKKSNRRKTYEDNRIQVLKKVNPTFILDELTF